MVEYPSTMSGDGSYVDCNGCGLIVCLVVTAVILFIFVFGVCLRWI